MKFYKKNIIVLLFVTVLFSLSAKDNGTYIKGEILIQFQNNFTEIETFLQKYASFQGKETELRLVERLSENLNIWHFRFNENINHTQFVAQIVSNTYVKEWQYNYNNIKNRATTPNDPRFTQQWQYINNGGSGGVIGADIDANLAWDITTGGLTPLGDTIVLCIVDDGVLDTHEDLEENLWVNHKEIPNNNIDDDNNGYVDDYKGYNAGTNNDDIYASFYSHGNAVAGVAGAKGNNNIGVAGINWDVKLMIVKYGGVTQAEVIKAYEYPLKMRKKYNQSNGAEGAFVVAVNSSWGIDGGNPSNFPLWCNFYDEMGQVGILNLGATANANTNVDTDGDMPTACSSNYLISVTNVGRNDMKVSNAGYGATSIDLGAFGEDAYTVSQFSTAGYGAFGGTSGATPQVAGAVALLYAAPCTNFAQLAKDSPVLAALKVKNYILNGVDANASLQGISTTGGRLNLMGALTALNNDCSNDCPSIISYGISQITDNSALVGISIQGEDSLVVAYKVRYRLQNTTTWTEISSNTNVILLQNLLANKTYDVEVKIDCDSIVTHYDFAKIFNTLSTSISSFEKESEIKIFPNPANHFIEIEQVDGLKNSLNAFIIDINGKQLLKQKVYYNKQKIAINTLNKGIYIIKLSDDDGFQLIYKLVKK